MMTPKRKKYITYATIGFYFFFSGVEYAVILPTAWLYLHERFKAQPYMLGMILSAFCLSSMIAGPIMGRWSDQIQRTKVVLLFANMWQVAGSLLYWFGYGPWCLVAGRFVAGIGTGMGPVILADIARVTSVEERTATLSAFSAIRQLGLLIGPACNLFLRKMDFKIGPYVVDKFTSPGLFMAVLWAMFEILIVLLYWELPKIQRQMQGDYLKAQVDDSYHRSHVNSLPNAATPSSALLDSEDMPSVDAFSSRSSDIVESPDGSPVKKSPSARMRSPPISAAINQNNLDTLFTSSNEMIESAERFMATPEPSDESPSNGLYFENSYFGASGSQHYPVLDEQFQSHACERNRQLTESYNRQYTSGAGIQSQDFESPVANADTPEDSAKSASLWSCKFYYEEYMREEIVVLLSAVFISFFVQIALETLLTPLANLLMDWDELQISYLYIGCSVEVLVLFAVLNLISKKVEDRTLILFGYLCEVVTLAYLMWYLPSAPRHNEAHNLPFLLVSLFFNILGLPFLVVCSNSLYSKLTRKESQGFSQGIRRFSGGLGNLLAPLWAGGLVNNLAVLIGVLLAMITLATLMLILSFKKLKPKIITQQRTGSNLRRHQGGVINPSERTPLLSNT